MGAATAAGIRFAIAFFLVTLSSSVSIVFSPPVRKHLQTSDAHPPSSPSQNPRSDFSALCPPFHPLTLPLRVMAHLRRVIFAVTLFNSLKMVQGPPRPPPSATSWPRNPSLRPSPPPPTRFSRRGRPTSSKTQRDRQGPRYCSYWCAVSPHTQKLLRSERVVRGKTRELDPMTGGVQSEIRVGEQRKLTQGTTSQWRRAPTSRRRSARPRPATWVSRCTCRARSTEPLRG